MNWIKGNGFNVHCAKIAILLVIIQTFVGMNFAIADNLSSGKPYYAQEQLPSGTTTWKWFAAYYNYSSNEPSIYSTSQTYNFSVYSPCYAEKCTLMYRTTDGCNTHISLIYYKDNEDIYESISVSGYSWVWYYQISDNAQNKDLLTHEIKFIRAKQTEDLCYVYFNNVQIELAPHLLLENGTDFGTTNLTIDSTAKPVTFGKSQVIKIPFRSFLTKRTIKIKMLSGDPKVFRVNNSSTACTTSNEYTILSGDNNNYMCAARGCSTVSSDTYKGTQGTNRSAGNAADLDVPVYYYPTSAGEQTATFIITSGQFKDTVTIKAKGQSYQTDLVPSQGDKSGSVSTTSGANPYWNGTNWLSVCNKSDSNIKLQRRTITSFAVYPPCTGDLKIKFNAISGQNSPATSDGANGKLFALGLNNAMTYSDNTGATNYLSSYYWTGKNVFGLKTVSENDLTTYKNKLYTIQIYNAVGADVNVDSISLQLANHILFGGNTEYGRKDTTFQISLDPSKLGQPIKVSVPFRSFLINGNMKIKMDNNGDPKVFRFDDSSTKCTNTTIHTLLNNNGSKSLCGIDSEDANIKGNSNYEGTTSQVVPGDASLLDFEIYVYPTTLNAYSATFKIYDDSNESNNCATVTINLTVGKNQIDLYPEADNNDKSCTVSTDSEGKPCFSNNTWYSLYLGNTKELQKRTITHLAVYPPCQGDLKLTFTDYSTPTKYTSSYASRNNAALFAIGFNKMLQYKSTDFTNDDNNNNDGTKNYVWYWNSSSNLSNEQTIGFETDYSTYRDSIYNVEIYNAIGQDVNVQNIKLELANHVLIDDSTAFGTKISSHEFTTSASTFYVGDSIHYTFKLRSFLTNSGLELKIVDSEDKLSKDYRIVSIGGTQINSNSKELITKGNICGFSGGAQTSNFDFETESSSINTNNLDIVIAYCPTTAGTPNATLKFIDGTTESASVTLTGCQATAGTLTFDDNSGDHSWFTASNWKTESNQRSTKYPGAADDVQIAANCTIPNCSTAVAKAVAINGGVLTVEENAVLNATSIQNTDETKLLLKADLNHSASVLFNSGVVSNSPRATVQCYFRGTPEQSTSSDNKPVVTPEWQYRGFIGDPDAHGWSNTDVLVYQWNEQKNGWDTGNNGDGKISQGVEWVGYSMGLTDVDAITDVSHRIKTYATTLIPTDESKTLNLAKSGQGLNLVTNSFSAPVKIKDITFTNVNSEIVFFKTNSYAAVNQAKTDDKLMTDIYVTFPQETGEITDVEDNIPAGASFFCLANAANPSITLKTPVAEASGAMYAPREQEEFNVLKIYAESESESDEVYLVESDNCSHNYDDGYDGTKYFTDGMGQIYGKNDFGRTFIAADSSMLGQMIGFKAGSNDMTYTLRFEIERLTGYDELYLYDRVTKRYVNILEGGTYSFTGSTEGEDERFQIIGRMEDSDSFITGSDHAIEVVADRALLRGFDGEDETIYMTDLAGKVVWSDNAKNGPWFELPTNIASGLYIIHCGDATAKYLKR